MMKKRAVSFFLALVMCLALAPKPRAAERVFELGQTQHFTYQKSELSNYAYGGDGDARLPLGSFKAEEAGYYLFKYATFDNADGQNRVLNYFFVSSEYEFGRNALVVLGDAGYRHLNPQCDFCEIVAVDGNVQVNFWASINIAAVETSVEFDLTVEKLPEDHILTKPDGDGGYRIPALAEGDDGVYVIPSYRVRTDGWYIPLPGFEDGNVSTFCTIKGDAYMGRLWWESIKLKSTDQVTVAIWRHVPGDAMVFNPRGRDFPTLSRARNDVEGNYFGYFTPEFNGKYAIVAERPEGASAWRECLVTVKQGNQEIEDKNHGFADDKRSYKTSVFLEKGVDYLINARGFADEESEYASFTLRLERDFELTDEEVLSEAKRYGLLRYTSFESISEPLTNLELAKLLVQADNLSLDFAQSELPFTDCGALSREEKAVVNAVASEKYMKEYPDGTFKPNGTLTRAQLASAIRRLSALRGFLGFAGPKPEYSDVDVKSEITTLLWLHIAPQTPTFGPEITATRKDALAMLVRACYGGYVEVKRDTPVSPIPVPTPTPAPIPGAVPDPVPTPTPTPTEPAPVNPFVDVPKSEFYYEAVAWAVEKKITTGVGDGSFVPNGSCTRAQAITFLWRAAGMPAPKADSNPFADVSAQEYYCKAVLWAKEQGITNGVSVTEFAPNATVSRSEIMTLLWRMAGKPLASRRAIFYDVIEGDYYDSAVAWAVESGITFGMGENGFAPGSECLRGQIVTFLYRHFSK